MRRYTESEKQLEAELIATNLRRVATLNRRGLLLFLDKESSREATPRLRNKARRLVIHRPGGDVDLDLTRIEHMLKEAV